MTAQELKNSILQLAIQGKLVEQRPEEGTAEELYRRIQSEKAKLLKAGKIKKEKPLPEITEDEIPFEIPETWKWVHFLDIAYLTSGNQYEEKKTGIPYLKVADMNLPENQIEITTSSRFASKDNEGMILTNSIIFPKRGGAIATNKKRIIKKTPVYIDSNSMGMTIIFDQTFDYIKKWFDTIDLGKLQSGTSVPQINNKDLYPLLIPLPPLEEQKRIVAKIEEIFPYIERFGKLRSQLRSISEDLRKSILQQAIQGKLVEQRPEEGTAEELYRQIQSEKAKLLKSGKIKKEKPLPEITEDEIPFEIPETWKWVRLQEVGELSRGRSQRRPRNDPSLFVNGTFPMIQTGDVARANGHITHWETEYNEEGVAQSRIWPKGTVCLTIAANIGDVAILDFDACFPDSVVGFNAYKPVDSNEFFMYGMMCYKNILDALSRSTAQKNINIDILSKIYFPLPPLKEQKRIVAKIEEVLKLCDKLK